MDAARRPPREWRSRGVSSILVDRGDGELGIVTDRDLRSRVVAAGRPVETPVGEVMTAPVVTVRPEQTGDELMLLMIDHGIRHVPVVSSARRAASGVATDIDLLANETHTPFVLRRAIADAGRHSPASATVGAAELDGDRDARGGPCRHAGSAACSRWWWMRWCAG